MRRLDQVCTPTLLIVGGVDYGVIELNERGVDPPERPGGAGDHSWCESSLPGAGNVGGGYRSRLHSGFARYLVASPQEAGSRS